MYIIFLGAPGAGKGTQAVSVARELNLAHIATGDLFRQAIETNTELGKQVKSFVEEGVLVPDKLTTRVVMERISTPDCERGVILDGFPRTLAQATALDKTLAEQFKFIDLVIYIQVSQQELIRRLSSRLVCRHCQTPYNLIDSQPEVSGKCDKCGGKLYQRPDDTAKAVKKRLQVYFTETAPLIDYYTTAGKLVEIRGEGGVDKVREKIMAVIGERSLTGLV